MTRFFVCTSYEETVEQMCKMLDRFSYTWKITTKEVMQFLFFFADYKYCMPISTHLLVNSLFMGQTGRSKTPPTR